MPTSFNAGNCLITGAAKGVLRIRAHYMKKIGKQAFKLASIKVLIAKVITRLWHHIKLDCGVQYAKKDSNWEKSGLI